MKKRLAIITTHPIQYNAPLFALLAKRANIIIKVFYTWGETVLQKKYDPGFNKNIEWDIPLLEGYDYTFVENVATEKGSHHFKGINNPGLIKEIKAWQADALLVYGWAFKSHLKVMRYFYGKIPVLFRGDSISLVKLPFLKNQARNFFLKWVYRNIDYALYVGTHNKNYFKELGLKERQLLFAPHAVDNERFKSVSKLEKVEIEKWRQSFGIDPNSIVFLYAGKLDENKNVALLARAFSEINNQNIHLIIAGNGISERELKDCYGSNPRIHFLPFQNQSKMPALYGLSDVFVLPSLSETWGLAINEAMACGKAIVVSNSCGAAIDLIKDGKNGYTFKYNNLQDLRNRLILCAESKERLEEMGHQSRMIEGWNFALTAKAIENILMKHKES